MYALLRFRWSFSESEIDDVHSDSLRSPCRSRHLRLHPILRGFDYAMFRKINSVVEDCSMILPSSTVPLCMHGADHAKQMPSERP